MEGEKGSKLERWFSLPSAPIFAFARSGAVNLPVIASHDQDALEESLKMSLSLAAGSESSARTSWSACSLLTRTGTRGWNSGLGFFQAQPPASAAQQGKG
jgi:hypothetical protein